MHRRQCYELAAPFLQANAPLPLPSPACASYFALRTRLLQRVPQVCQKAFACRSLSLSLSSRRFMRAGGCGISGCCQCCCRMHMGSGGIAQELDFHTLTGQQVWGKCDRISPDFGQRCSNLGRILPTSSRLRSKSLLMWPKYIRLHNGLALSPGSFPSPSLLSPSVSVSVFSSRSASQPPCTLPLPLLFPSFFSCPFFWGSVLHRSSSVPSSSFARRAMALRRSGGERFTAILRRRHGV